MANLFNSIEAEQAIIALIANDDSFDRIVTQFIPKDFSKPEHQQIIEVMQMMFAEKKKIDLITIDAELAAKFGRETGMVLLDLIIKAIQTEGASMARFRVKEYSDLIKSTAMRRNMLEIIEQAKIGLTTTTDDTSVILDKTRQGLRDIVVTRHTWKSMTDVMIATYDALGRKAAGDEPMIPSGISCLDSVTTGFHKGELTIIGARPAVGKSAMGAHIALSAAEKGYKVGICSREMTDIQYGTRIISRSADIDNSHLRTGQLEPEEWESIGSVIGAISNLPVSFMFSARYIEDLRMEVQKKVDAGELDMLMVDYVQLIQTRQKFEKDYLRIGYVSKMLKDMTVDFDISVVALAQVGRSVENTMPNLADLRGSGDLEQDADNVIFMHRPKDASDRYVHPMDRNAFEDIRNRGMQYIALNIAKQRQGQIGTMAVIFDPAKMRYMPIERRE